MLGQDGAENGLSQLTVRAIAVLVVLTECGPDQRVLYAKME
jgi:hypothetical protein